MTKYSISCFSRWAVHACQKRSLLCLCSNRWRSQTIQQTLKRFRRPHGSRQHCLLPLPLASHVVAKVAVDFAVLFLTEIDFLRASFFISPLELLTGTWSVLLSPAYLPMPPSSSTKARPDSECSQLKAGLLNTGDPPTQPHAHIPPPWVTPLIFICAQKYMSLSNKALSSRSFGQCQHLKALLCCSKCGRLAGTCLSDIQRSSM